MTTSKPPRPLPPGVPDSVDGTYRCAQCAQKIEDHADAHAWFVAGSIVGNSTCAAALHARRTAGDTSITIPTKPCCGELLGDAECLCSQAVKLTKTITPTITINAGDGER